MEQLKAMLEKARTDKEFGAKLEELGKSGAQPEAIVAFAAEHGFTITAEDLNSCRGDCAKCGELTEDELENVSGAGPTQDRYDPNECPTRTRTHYYCVGFLKLTWCDHFRRIKVQESPQFRFRHICEKPGGFNYIGDSDGEPKYDYTGNF